MIQTLVWAECPNSSGLDILVRPHRGARVTGAVLRDAFEVVTNDEPRCRRWLGGSTRKAMLKASGYRFRMVHGRVEAVAAMRAVAAFSKPTSE